MEQGKQKEEGGKENLEKDTHMKINEKKREATGSK